MAAAGAMAMLMHRQVVWVEGEAAAHLMMVFHKRVATRVQGHVRSRRRLAQSRMHGPQHLWRRWAQPHQPPAS